MNSSNYSPINPLMDITQLPLHMAPWMLWAALGVFLFFYAIISVILLYHWIAYGMRARGVVVAELLFPIVSAIFIYMAMIGITTTF